MKDRVKDRKRERWRKDSKIYIERKIDRMREIESERER